jgi:hypothetical protein
MKTIKCKYGITEISIIQKNNTRVVLDVYQDNKYVGCITGYDIVEAIKKRQKEQITETQNKILNKYREPISAIADKCK